MTRFLTALLDSLLRIKARAEAGRAPVPEFNIFPPGRCHPEGSAGMPIEKDQHYLTVTVNELHLAEARHWFSVYDPMVLVDTTVLYGGQTITVPAVVGPSLLASKGCVLTPGLLLLQDTTIAGPFPYRGDPVAISLRLYRVRRKDYARSLLRVVESVAGAIGPAADMVMLAKVGDALLDGVESLLGLQETEPVAGHRIELSRTKPGGLRTGFSALIADGEAGRQVWSDLHVVDGRLRTGGGSGPGHRFEAADYVLYSITASQTRGSETSLSAWPLYERALADAARGNDAAWKSAKGTFSEVWQQLLLSPDLTPAESIALRQDWQLRLQEEHVAGQRRENMGPQEPPGETSARTAGAAAVLDL